VGRHRGQRWPARGRRRDPRDRDLTGEELAELRENVRDDLVALGDF